MTEDEMVGWHHQLNGHDGLPFCGLGARSHACDLGVGLHKFGRSDLEMGGGGKASPGCVWDTEWPRRATPLLHPPPCWEGPVSL